MKLQHKKMASGNWSNLSLSEQMANVGSEVERAINWKNKGNSIYSQKAFERALELLDLTISCSNKSSLKELTRTREVLVDYFIGDNQYSSSDDLWRKYFHAFNYNARVNQGTH